MQIKNFYYTLDIKIYYVVLTYLSRDSSPAPDSAV